MRFSKGGVFRTATLPNNNRLSGFGYDAAGNMTQNGSATFTYDAENRLTSAAGYTYYYDGDGKRVRKTNGSTGTLYWMGTGSDVLSETDLSGVVQSEYVFFNGKRVARYDPPTNTYHYYFSDHLGSTSVETGGAGIIQDDWDYYPYGGTIPRTVNDTGNHYKFTGKERDGESGLDNFDFRYYGSSLGRFMSPDEPFYDGDLEDPQQLNLYNYVMNRPTVATDPDGHDCVYAESSVSVVRGDCLSDTDNGVYVNGTIDLNSFTYNPQSNSLGFSYTPEDAGPGTFGAGTIGLPTARMDSGAVSPEGEQYLGQYALGMGFGRAIVWASRGMASLFGTGAEKATADVVSETVNLADQKATTHVLDGDATGGGHAPGTGIPGKSEFPAGWSRDKIMQEISDVATDPASKVTQAGKTTVVQGTRDGINIKVIIRDGRIVTGYPTNVSRNP